MLSNSIVIPVHPTVIAHAWASRRAVALAKVEARKGEDWNGMLMECGNLVSVRKIKHCGLTLFHQVDHHVAFHAPRDDDLEPPSLRNDELFSP